MSKRSNKDLVLFDTLFNQTVEENEDVPELELLLYIASMAYEEKTGLDDDVFFELFDQLGGIRPGQPDIVLDWDENDEEGLSQKFPLLWGRFGDNPLG